MTEANVIMTYLTKDDLVNLVCGVELGDPRKWQQSVIRDYGDFNDHSGWQWDRKKLKKQSPEFLFNLYRIATKPHIDLKATTRTPLYMSESLYRAFEKVMSEQTNKSK